MCHSFSSLHSLAEIYHLPAKVYLKEWFQMVSKAGEVQVNQGSSGSLQWGDFKWAHKNLLVGIYGEKQGNSKKNARICVHTKATEEISFPGTQGGPCGESAGSTFGKPCFLPEFTSLSNYIWPKLILTWFCWPVSICCSKARKGVSETDQRKIMFKTKQKIPINHFVWATESW